MKKKNTLSKPKVKIKYFGIMPERPSPEGTPESEQLTVMQYQLKNLPAADRLFLKKENSRLKQLLCACTEIN